MQMFIIGHENYYTKIIIYTLAYFLHMPKYLSLWVKLEPINLLILFLAVSFLATLYIEGEKRYSIEEDKKVTTVIVERTKYQLSEEGMDLFESIHDDWELEICKKYPHDVLIGGKHNLYMTTNSYHC